jgi:MFS family permease
VFGATVVSNLGDGIVTVALAFAVLDLTHSATDLGLILACKLAAQVVMLLVGGVVADRVSRQRVMMAADLVRLVGQAVMGILLIGHDATVVELGISQVILGGAAAFFQPASMGLVPALAGEFRHEANAMRGIASASSGIVGPALGALLVAAVGAEWGLLADAASYGLSALLLSRVHHAVGSAPAPAAGENRSIFGDLAAGWSEVRSRTWVWALIIGFGVSNSLMETWNVFGPLSMRRWYEGAPSYAVLSIAFSVGTLLGGVVSLRFRPRRPLFIGTLVCLPVVLPSILVALRLPLGFVVPVQLISGIGPIAFNTLWWTALQDHIPTEALSRVVSFDYAGSYLILPLGTALAGPLADAIGLRNAMLACAFAAIASVGSTLLLPSVRNLRASPVKADIVNA